VHFITFSNYLQVFEVISALSPEWWWRIGSDTLEIDINSCIQRDCA